MPNAVQSERETDVDLFFGGREWRTIYARYQRQEEQFLHRQLMDHYKSKLIRLGYKAWRDDETPPMRNAKNAPLYRLLFASKSRLGADFWGKIIARNVHGRRRLF